MLQVVSAKKMDSSFADLFFPVRLSKVREYPAILCHIGVAGSHILRTSLI